jgi:flagellar motor switch protein FliM/N
MPCKAWLPPGALCDGAVERALADAVWQWSENWFARRLMRPVDQAAPFDRTAFGAGDLQFHFLEGGLAVALDDRARLAIAGMMLDAAVEPAALTPADRPVLDGLATSCVDDLCSRLAQAFNVADGARWRSGGLGALPFGEARAFAFGVIDGEPLVRVIVETHLAIALIKSTAPSATPIPLRPIAAGLARQSVAVSALLGRCELTLAELAELASGDVLVLDRELSLPLDLALDGAVKSGHCTVEQEGEKLRLKIIKSFFG